MTFRDLVLRLRALIRPGRVARELDDELAFHIERDTQKHIADGLPPAAARRRALQRFGPVPLAADLCRDARGTAVVDTVVRDVSFALRACRRAPLAALTIVATVALGLGLVTVVFTAYNIFFLRADAVRNPGELFAVERTPTPGAEAGLPFTRAEYDAMRRETGAFTDLAAILRDVRTRVEGRTVTGALVTGSFFQMLGVQAALGRALTPDDDARSAGRPAIVLSHRGWNKLFAADPAAIGRIVRLNGLPVAIVGVMPDGFRGLALGPPDYWTPLALAPQFRDIPAGKEGEMPVEIVGRLKPGMSSAAAAAALAIWSSQRRDAKTVPDAPASIVLKPRQGTLSADVVEQLAFTSPIFFAFGLILMIGCANVANLLLARGVARQREIGIRLSLGASRARIIRQLLTESLLLALAAAACGLVLSRLFWAGVTYAAMVTVPPELVAPVNLTVPVVDWRVLVFLAAGATVATAAFGLAPALQTTRLEIVRTMRGEVIRDARPGRARHALIAAQVGASALLLIGAAIFLRGALAAATADLGVRTSDTVMLTVPNEPRRTALLRAVIEHPAVAAVAAWSEPTVAVAEPSASDGGTSPRTPVDLMTVSPDYFDLLGARFLTGRGFTQTQRSASAGVVVVTETAASRLWPGRDAVGQVLQLGAPASNAAASSPPRTFTVVGVVRDPGGRLQIPDSIAFRGVYVPASPEDPGTSLLLRVRGDPALAREGLLERLASVDPGLGSIITMRALARVQTYVLRLVFWVTVALGGLALVLTVSGLFSVLSYVVEQRTREIGVRMALGATSGNVAALVLSQSLGPVSVGLLTGGGLAAAVALILMATPLASTIDGFVHVLDPVAYSVGALVIAASCLAAALVPAVRAAAIDPVVTLRRD